MASQSGQDSITGGFGSTLNANLHFHCAIVDGVFSPILSAVEGAETEGVRFHEATALTGEDIAAVQHEVRSRVLRLFRRRDLLSPMTSPRCAAGGTAGVFRSTPRSASRLATVRDSNACSAIAPARPLPGSA